MPTFRFEFKNIPYKAAMVISIGIFVVCLGIALSFVMYGGIKLDKKPEDKPKVGVEEKIDEMGSGSDTMLIEVDGIKLEQKPAPGTKLTIEKDGEKTSITKGGPPPEEP